MAPCARRPDAARSGGQISDRADSDVAIGHGTYMPKTYQSGDITPIRGVPVKSRKVLRQLSRLLDAAQGEVVEAALDLLFVQLAQPGVLHHKLQETLLSEEQLGTLSYQALLSTLDERSAAGPDDSSPIDPVMLQLYRAAANGRCITPLPDEEEFQRRRRERKLRIDRIVGRVP